MSDTVGAMERAAKALEHYVLHPRAVAVEVVLAFLDEGDAQLAQDAWANLQATCAASGKDAKRLVLVSENDVAAAVSTALRAIGCSRPPLLPRY